MGNNMRSGMFVRTSRLIDYAPYTLIDVGERGRVVGEVENAVIVKLLKPHPALAPWGNNVTLMPEDAEALVPIMSPILLKRAFGATVTAVGAVVGVMLLPQLSISPVKLHAANLEKVYLLDGPSYVTRVNKLLDGTYAVVTFHRTQAGRPYTEIIAMRHIEAADVETEVHNLE